MASPPGRDEVVIIGSGLAGYAVARELRRRDRGVALTMITADGGDSYSKPNLSAALAQGKSPADLVQKSAGAMAADLSIRVLTHHRVEAILREDHLVTVRRPDGGLGRVGYDRLVLAVGADPRPYRVAGSPPVQIHAVNDLDDYAVWRTALTPGARVLLVGAGLIGCEFANDLAATGHAVTVVDPAPWPLGRLLPEALGRALASALGEIGVTFHFGRSLARIEPGRAWLDDGRDVAFDLALSAIGLVPRTGLAAAAGLAVNRGIMVDRWLRTADPTVFAVGDCAETPAGVLPFIAPLLAGAKAIAATLAGEETALVLPAMPVVVKTPALPSVVCPPPPEAAGSWTVEGEGRDVLARFHAPDGAMLGFALCGGDNPAARARVLAAGLAPVLV